MPRRSLICLAACLLTATVLLAGCAPGRASTERAAELADMRYPEQAQQGPALDVVVRATGNTLRLANRTARSYTDMQLWLNRAYVRRVERIDIGTRNRLPLTSFINRYQEPFPIGGFLAPEERAPVVLAELYDPEANVRYPLVAHPELD